MLYYGDGLTDYFMKHNTSFPRYASLACKTISHYLSDLYNPETFSYEAEFIIRQMIKAFVKLKVFDKQPYDWLLIDHSFRECFNKWGYTHITYDQSILDKGYNGTLRGLLSEYRS